MTTTTTTPDTEPTTGTAIGSVDVLSGPDLIGLVRAERRTRDAAEVRILRLALTWAERHTVTPAVPHPGRSAYEPCECPDFDHPESIEWLGLPELRWDSAASFAAALGIPTGSGKSLIRDVLVLTHRLPKVWARVTAGGDGAAGDVPAWRARRVAQAVLGEPDDVTAYVDTHVAPIAATIGTVTLDRVVDEAKLRLHPEEREADQLEALDARHVTLFETSIGHTGIADLAIRGDWADVAAFDDTITAVAAAIKLSGTEGSEETLDVRRSIAVGILADPERAQALLDHAVQTAGSACTPTPSSSPSRTLLAHVRLQPGHLLGLDPVVLDDHGRAVLEQIVRDWAGRTDTHVSVRPIRHCGGCADCTHDTDHDTAEALRYAPNSATRERVLLRDRHCMFPHCTRPARTCDLDHSTPFDHTDPTRGGPTCHCNLTPLCRHHHQLKTHARWRYTTLEPGHYLWTDHYNQTFLTTRHSTTDLTESSPPG